MTVVTNAGPLIILARIGQASLLPALFGEVIMPPAVRNEIFAGGEHQAGAATFREAAWLQMRSVSDRTAVAFLRERLDAGESEAIALALQIGADFVLMDEARGRRVAAARGLPLTGTLGVLLLAKEQSLIGHVAPHLADLMAEGFYLSDALREHVLRRAGESEG